MIHFVFRLSLVALFCMFVVSNSTVAEAAVSNSVAGQSQCVSITGPLLSLGSTGLEVQRVQQILNRSLDTVVATSGPGAPGFETQFFGALTKHAVMKFQQKYASEILVPADLIHATGIVGMYTRKKMNALCNADVSATVTSTSLSAARSGRSAGGKSKGRTGVAPQVTPATTTQNVVVATTTLSTSPAPVTPPPVVQPKPMPTTTIPIAPTTTPATPRTVAGLEWGAFAGYSPAELATFETLAGKPVQLKSVFIGWQDSFPIGVTPGLKEAGKTLVIFWEQHGVTLDSIIAGESDAYIKRFAEASKNYGGQIILAPFHEMNGNWTPWSGVVGSNTPAKVIAAWQHLRDVYGAVPNVKFAWTVNSNSVPDTTANAIVMYYPGDAYVDYVAVDGFNFGSPWVSFDTIFAKPLATLSAYKKPMYILSMATAAGIQKASWITDAITVQMKKYPLLKGWVWFNEDKEQDWRIDSSTASLNAFRSVLP